MRNIFIFLSFFFSALCFSQVDSGEITYSFDLKLQDVTVERKATLLFADSTAVFYHSRGKGIVMVDIDGRVGGPLMSYTTGPEHNGMSVLAFYKKDALGHTFYTDLGRNQMTAREIIYFRSFLYEEPGIPKIEWQQVDSTKTIGDYLCRAAITQFRGRKYTVWYTPEIPLPFGPWKLQGLPGLVLEASDDEKRIVYTARSIRFGLQKREIKSIKPPDKAKRTITFEEFKKIHWKEQLRVNRVAESTTGRSGGYKGISRHQTMEIFE